MFCVKSWWALGWLGSCAAGRLGSHPAAQRQSRSSAQSLKRSDLSQKDGSIYNCMWLYIWPCMDSSHSVCVHIVYVLYMVVYDFLLLVCTSRWVYIVVYLPCMLHTCLYVHGRKLAFIIASFVVVKTLHVLRCLTFCSTCLVRVVCLATLVDVSFHTLQWCNLTTELPKLCSRYAWRHAQRHAYRHDWRHDFRHDWRHA